MLEGLRQNFVQKNADRSSCLISSSQVRTVAEMPSSLVFEHATLSGVVELQDAILVSVWRV